ncbi:MAG: hypothetical protein WAV54_09880 [Acidimicrobiales bacterium]
MSEILVAFATRNGSTEAVAEVVAATMRAAGETVELRLARKVREPLGQWDFVCAEQTPGRARLKRARLEASPAGDAATRAVLARASRHDPGHRAVPMPPRPMEREGPNLGR